MTSNIGDQALEFVQQSFDALRSGNLAHLSLHRAPERTRLLQGLMPSGGEFDIARAAVGARRNAHQPIPLQRLEVAGERGGGHQLHLGQGAVQQRGIGARQGGEHGVLRGQQPARL